MIDVGAAFELLMDVAGEKDPLQVVSDARATYDFYADPASVAADVKAGKLAAVTGPLSRTLALADRLANDPGRAPHLLALVKSLAS